ncbi:MAG: DUF1697 domain-containing protein [Archangium sp.]|nr:DUF1697 domain-containing protein [Archangium sp.]
MRTVALLRSLNLGAHNRIGMKDLAAVFEGAGCTKVETFIQSGNVVFDASAAVLRKVPALVATALKSDFDVTSPVVLRDAKELAAVVKNNPFLKRGEALTTLHVGFLLEKPDAGLVKALDPLRSAPDEFQVLGREVYLHLPNGVGRSKLTNAWFDAKLKGVVTVRNWNTVVELSHLALRRSGGLTTVV